MVAGRLTTLTLKRGAPAQYRGASFSGEPVNLYTIVTGNIVQAIQRRPPWAFVIWKASRKRGAPDWRLRSRRIVQTANLDPDPVFPSGVYPSLHKGDAIRPL